MRNLKQMGVALVAVLAMSAIAASAASANQFHSTATNTTWTVASAETQGFLFEAGGKTITCQLSGSGEMTAATVTEVTFKPACNNGTVDGIPQSQAEVSMNGCDYLLTIEAAKNEGPIHIACTGTSQITITVRVLGISICTLHIGKQTPSGRAVYGNEGSSQIKVQPNQTGISGTRQGNAECGSPTSNTGSYTGRVVFKGEATGQQTAASIQVG